MEIQVQVPLSPCDPGQATLCLSFSTYRTRTLEGCCEEIWARHSIHSNRTIQETGQRQLEEGKSRGYNNTGSLQRQDNSFGSGQIWPPLARQRGATNKAALCPSMLLQHKGVQTHGCQHWIVQRLLSTAWHLWKDALSVKDTSHESHQKDASTPEKSWTVSSGNLQA